MSSAIVSCPHCGAQGSQPLRGNNAAIVVSCRQCHKNFKIEIRNGQVIGVRRS